MICPRNDCNGELNYFEELDKDSLLAIGIFKTWICDNCGAGFSYKEASHE